MTLFLYRLDSGLDLDRGLPAMYTQDHSALDSRKSNFFRDPTESLSPFTQGPEDAPGPLDRAPVSGFDPEEQGLPSGEEVEALGHAMLQRSVSQGSSHSLKLDEPRFDGLPLGPKSLELQDTGDRADDKVHNEFYSQAAVTSNRATPPADGLHKQEKLPLPAPSKQKAELRWGGRSGTGRREGLGGDRPVRRSGPIKKPVLRDMKEEREQREEREKRHERGERPKKDMSAKAPSAAAVVSEGSRPQGEEKREPSEVEETPSVLQRARDSQPSSGAPTSSQEEKTDKLPSNDKHPEPKLPSRKESNLPPRAYRREERERDREREKEREKEIEKDRERDWPADSNFKGRGRGEYYSRGRSYRGTYRGRVSRGRSRAEYPYREPRSRSDLPSAGGAAAFRNREESETRSESSDFEVIPKRRRRRGSDTDSESEGGRESASDTGPSDREPSTKPSQPFKRDLPGDARSGPHKPGFGPPHIGEKGGSRGDDESRPKPGFLPKGEPSRRGRGGLYNRRGGARERGGLRSAPLRRPGARESSSQWPSKPMETFRPEDTDTTPSRYDNPQNDRRPPRSEGKKFGEGAPQSSRERPRRSRPARPPRQDKPPRFRRLKEREAAVLAGGETTTSMSVPLPEISASAVPSSAPASVSLSPALSRAPGTPVTVPADVSATMPAPDLPSSIEASLPETSSPTIAAIGTKSPDLSNQNSSDQANEEWETASESSDFNERREREERKGAMGAMNDAATASAPAPAPVPPQGSVTPSKNLPDGGVTPKRDGAPTAKRSFSSQRPTDRQNRRGNTGAKPGRSYTGGKGERRGGAKAGRKG